MNRSDRRQEKKNQEKWIDEMINAQKNMMRHGDHSPTLLIMRMVVEGKMQTIPVLISNVHELTTANEVAKRFINKYNPDTWIFFDEGLAMSCEKIGEVKIGDTIIPDKFELLSIIAKNREETIEITEQYNIIRNNNDKIINLKPFWLGEKTYLKAKFLNENPKITVNARLGVKK